MSDRRGVRAAIPGKGSLSVKVSMTPSKRALVRWASLSLRAVLPWPMFALCEELYLRMVKHLCQPNRDSIDIGANIGTYLHAMKRHSRQVYAFEPVPWLAQLLAKKFGQQVVIENVALSRDSGTAVLHIPIVEGALVTGLSTLSDDLARQALHQDVLVETRPLDDVYSGNVGFIKVDVEGHEYSVLQGARRTVARWRPRVLVEAEERHEPGSVRRVQAFFYSLGYQGYFVRQRRLARIEDFDPERMQRSEDIADYTLGVPRARFERYINNFLFLPPNEPSSTLTRLESAL
jgi:FkbM family methyltransferase